MSDIPMSADEQVQIINLEAQRYRAMLEGDVATLSGLCADELVYTHSKGERDDKKSYLSKVCNRFFVYHEIAHPADRVLVVGKVALVTGRMTARVTVAGEACNIDNSYLAVWVKKGRSWRFYAYQPTPRHPE
jgi:hypothetical protein